MTLDEWKSDIKLAKKAGIDGFIFNIAPQDDYTNAVVRKAYEAASELGDSTLLLSFDYLIIELIDTYKAYPRPDNVSDWPSVKNSTNCLFVPSWTRLGHKELYNSRTLSTERSVGRLGLLEQTRNHP
ncbi:mutanase [Coccidioides immitis H538.4]|uniref:Mutanase n=3 Tax=Coccidioides immitis TaxID=5501 RepID=A0A0J8TM39_COCIT|nr:hypothetical protein CIRG_03459 [Coccidioides immitis RMSCC 2394]KMU74742.1 hypothetical protein CISG_00672 [Coccidioides immitis RMSCC 3703]KMU83271.1 mutanase [Coccidioides immitis H538.4]